MKSPSLTSRRRFLKRKGWELSLWPGASGAAA